MKPSQMLILCAVCVGCGKVVDDSIQTGDSAPDTLASVEAGPSMDAIADVDDARVWGPGECPPQHPLAKAVRCAPGAYCTYMSGCATPGSSGWGSYMCIDGYFVRADGGHGCRDGGIEEK